MVVMLEGQVRDRLGKIKALHQVMVEVEKFQALE
tara:strand:- start:129 stop:230 length:102 start_codon:yes stop_codon:yes gene_type:complete